MAAGAIYGDGFLKLRPDLSGFGAELQAKTKGAGLAGAFGKIGKAAGLAFVGAAAVAVGAGIKGIVDFAGFERQMNEVFTLLPGISRSAMDEMTEQVQDFSREFGTLPEDVVPALYQSLSAGIPKENVFAFMETAQKAALGGATDLETAVDGISSVTNAYGDDVISAGEASDLMFTAVRKGKTTFDEMSNSLFNVIPTAAGLGVEFGDVTAALATMTAQGTPTSVATTQLRQLFVELSKEGGNAAKAFEDISGKSFQEFIAEGGNVAEALEIMQDAAGDSGVEIQDMFGSVEAGSAALSLTGSDSFTENLAEMGESAGATDAAFEQMDQGLSRSWDKIKAAFANAFLDIGQRLAPFVQKLSDFLAVNLPIWIETASGWFDRLGEWWNANGPAITAVVQGVFSAISEAIGTVVGVIQTVIGWFQSSAESAEGSFGGIREFAEATWPKVQEIIEGVMEVIRTVVGTVLDIIRAFWEQHGERVMSVISTVWGFIKGTIETVLGVIKGIIETVLGILTGDWSRAWDGIKSIVSGVWDQIKRVIETALEILKDIIPIALDFIQEVWETAWDTVFGFLGAIWDDIVEAVSDGFENVKEFFVNLPGQIVEWIGNMGGLLFNIGRDIISGLWDGLKDMWSNVTDWFSGLGDKIAQIKGPPSYDRKILTENGRLIMEGFQSGLVEGWGDVEDFLGSRVPQITSAVPGVLQSGTTTTGALGASYTIYAPPDPDAYARAAMERIEWHEAVKGRG